MSEKFKKFSTIKNFMKFSILAIIIYICIQLTKTYNIIESMLPVKELETYDYIEKPNCLFFPNESSDMGIIIYQGAKVQPYNYARIANDLQKSGFNVFVSKMPFNWPFLNINLATDIIKSYDTINSWFLGGHSMGGSMVSYYTNKNLTEKIKGIFFLGSCPVTSFSETNIPMLYIYAEYDKLTTDEDKMKANSNLSTSLLNEIIEIKGGNRANFGNYGSQSADGKATISSREQQMQTSKLINNWIYRILNEADTKVY